jgi:hypothetical protein
MCSCIGRRPFLVGAVALLVGCREAPLPKWDGDTLVHRAPGWELRIQYRYRGSPNEGQHGTLYRDGQEVAPAKQAERIETGLGWVMHYGERRRELWEVTGWNFADKDRILPSQRVRAE